MKSTRVFRAALFAAQRNFDGSAAHHGCSSTLVASQSQAQSDAIAQAPHEHCDFQLQQMAAKAMANGTGFTGHGKEDLYHAVLSGGQRLKNWVGYGKRVLDMTLSFLSSPRELILKDFSANLRLLKEAILIIHNRLKARAGHRASDLLN